MGKIDRAKPKLAHSVDGYTGENQICTFWRNKLAGILNSVSDDGCSRELRSNLENLPDNTFVDVSVEEVCLAADLLPGGRAPGIDNIPGELFKRAPLFVYRWLAELVSAIFAHNYIPCSITKVSLIPIVKNSTLDPCCSGNYRPLGIASSVSKIVERIILLRIDQYLGCTANQFGFKAGHSTDLCIFSFKEIVKYYLTFF